MVLVDRQREFAEELRDHLRVWRGKLVTVWMGCDCLSLRAKELIIIYPLSKKKKILLLLMWRIIHEVGVSTTPS